jgi:FkbM family methyltransferase
VLDVGASGGQFGHTLRAAGFTGRIVSFEPLAEPFRVLSEAAAADARWEVHRVALGDEPGRRRINVARNTTSSSFLEMHAEHAAAAPESAFVGTEEVDVLRLDDLARSLRLDGAVLLKLDVQGFQLPVLHGAESMLAHTDAVQCELSISPLYDGEPPLLDVVVALRDRGFELVELEPGFYDRATGRVLQFDGRFVRPASNGARTAAANRSGAWSSANARRASL